MYLPLGEMRAQLSPRLEEINLVGGPTGFASLVNWSCQTLAGCRTWA